MVEFEGAGIWETHPEAGCCMPIPNRHFHTWKVKVLPCITFSTTLLPFLNPERVQLPDGTPHGSITPAASRLVVYSVRWHMHSIASRTRNNCLSLNPRWIRSLVFLVLGASHARDRYLMERCYHFIRTWCSNSSFL